MLKKLAEQPYPNHLDVASVYFALGEKDQGFEWLNKGFDGHDPFIVRMTMYPALDELRSDPRYQKLVATRRSRCVPTPRRWTSRRMRIPRNTRTFSFGRELTAPTMSPEISETKNRS